MVFSDVKFVLGWVETSVVAKLYSTVTTDASQGSDHEIGLGVIIPIFSANWGLHGRGALPFACILEPAAGGRPIRNTQALASFS